MYYQPMMLAVVYVYIVMMCESSCCCRQEVTALWLNPLCLAGLLQWGSYQWCQQTSQQTPQRVKQSQKLKTTSTTGFGTTPCSGCSTMLWPFFPSTSPQFALWFWFLWKRYNHHLGISNPAVFLATYIITLFIYRYHRHQLSVAFYRVL